MQAILEATDLVVSVPKSSYYRTRWEQISSELQAGKSPTEMPLRASNQNTRKLHAEAAKYPGSSLRFGAGAASACLQRIY